MKNEFKNYLEAMLPNHQIQINLQFNKNLTEPDGCTHLIQAFQCTTKTYITKAEAKRLRENLNEIYAWEDNLDQNLTMELENMENGKTRITFLSMLNF